MHNEENQPTLRSPEVQDIISKAPTWPLRWGSGILLGIFVMSFLLAAWIKYPEVIKGSLKLGLDAPPLELVCQQAGTLRSLEVNDGTYTYSGQTLASLQASLPTRILDSLKPALHTLRDCLHMSCDSPSFPVQDLKEGQSLQVLFEKLSVSLSNYQAFLKDSSRLQSLDILDRQIKQHRHLFTVLNKKQRLAFKEAENAREDFEGDRYLYEQKVISKVQFFEEQSTFLQKEQALENIKEQLIQNEIKIAQLEKQFLESRNRYQEEKRQLKQSLLTAIDALESEIINLEQGTVFKAPFEGKIQFTKELQPGQYLKSGEIIMVLIPKTERYQARVQLSANGQGKVKPGQKVIIQLDNYPYREYGQLESTVSQVSELPLAEGTNGEKSYILQFELSGPLVTSYKKTLKPQALMTGTALIITEDLSLLQRLFAPFKDLMLNQA